MQNWLKLLRIIGAADEFRGAVKLQKIAYVLQTLGFVPGEQFIWHRFGPFSPSIASRLEELREMGAISMKHRKSPEVAQSFALTDVGREFLRVLGNAGNDDAIVALTQELQKWARQELEVVASVLYLHRRAREWDQAIEEVRELKPKIGEGVVTTALEKLKRFREMAMEYQ